MAHLVQSCGHHPIGGQRRIEHDEAGTVGARHGIPFQAVTEGHEIEVETLALGRGRGIAEARHEVGSGGLQQAAGKLRTPATVARTSPGSRPAASGASDFSAALATMDHRKRSRSSAARTIPGATINDAITIVRPRDLISPLEAWNTWHKPLSV